MVILPRYLENSLLNSRTDIHEEDAACQKKNNKNPTKTK